MLLIIDNYDSFTYNVVHYLRELDAEVVVVKNDECTVRDVEQMNPSGVVISPGPCTPSEAGISVPLIQCFAGRVPILGVCLGHQSIAQAFGANIVRAKKVMHGKTSRIFHHSSGVFESIESGFLATRYHSLVVDVTSLPSVLEVTAWTEKSEGEVDEVMAVRHRHYPIEGVQFHPEAILSEFGHRLFANFLRVVDAYSQDHRGCRASAVE